MKIIFVILQQIGKELLMHTMIEGFKAIKCKLCQKDKCNCKQVQILVEDQSLISKLTKTKNCKPGCQGHCCKTLVSQPQIKKLIVCKRGRWELPRKVLLTRFAFDNYQMSLITKIKCLRKYQPYSSRVQDDLYIMKVVVKQEDFIYSSYPHTIAEFFSRITFAQVKFSQDKIMQDITFQKEVSGTLLKKSGYFGKWDNVKVTINKDGLKYHQQGQLLQIAYIKEIWTWFQLHQKKYLIIKFKKVSSKRQFAIPLGELSKWLPAFMSLLTNSSNQISQEKIQQKNK